MKNGVGVPFPLHPRSLPMPNPAYWYATFLLALGFVATAAIGPCHSLLPPKVGWPLSLVCLLVGFLLFLHGFDVGWPAP